MVDGGSDPPTTEVNSWVVTGVVTRVGAVVTSGVAIVLEVGAVVDGVVVGVVDTMVEGTPPGPRHDAPPLNPG